MMEQVKLAGMIRRGDHSVCKRREKRVLGERSSPSFPNDPREARVRKKEVGGARDGGLRASVKTTKPAAVDEDLYKIPPELIFHCHMTKRKRFLGFFSRCLAPACTA